MTEQELRALIRGVIAQRPGGTPLPPDPASIPLPAAWHHASHALFVIPAPGESCVIEPDVPCNHCGYCKSYGH